MYENIPQCYDSNFLRLQNITTNVNIFQDILSIVRLLHLILLDPVPPMLSAIYASVRTVFVVVNRTLQHFVIPHHSTLDFSYHYLTVVDASVVDVV